MTQMRISWLLAVLSFRRRRPFRSTTPAPRGTCDGCPGGALAAIKTPGHAPADTLASAPIIRTQRSGTAACRNKYWPSSILTLCQRLHGPIQSSIAVRFAATRKYSRSSMRRVDIDKVNASVSCAFRSGRAAEL
jgi:hypothetical protein